MTLNEYLDGMRIAATPAELEAAIRAPHKHRFIGPTWRRICRVRVEAGERICQSHPARTFIPRFDARRVLTVCDQTYRVGRGHNGAGVRWVWADAKRWAVDVLRENGLTTRAAHAIWDVTLDYPHRALALVEKALAGKLPDPHFNRLTYTGRCITGHPVKVDRRYEAEHRAHRACKCGDGWLWDWGCGWNGLANVINWRCDRCSRTYVEYVTGKRLSEIRSLD